MRYHLIVGKQTLEVEIIQESEKFLTFREILPDGSPHEFRKKKPVSGLTPIAPSEFDRPVFNRWVTEPFNHQKEFLKFAETHDCFLLRDDPGLGKTKQALDLIINRKASGQIKSALIVCCLGILQYNWMSQIKIHTKLKGYILGTRPANKLGTAIKIGSNKDKLQDLKQIKSDIYICNVEALRNADIVAQLQLMIARGDIGQVVVDEVHKCKNSKAAQTAGLFSLHPKYKLALTGTPIINSPLDIYPLASWLGQELRSLSKFKATYCIFGGFKDKEIVGYQNLGDLNYRLNTWSLHRKKSECLDLPPKIVSVFYVELTEGQKALYNEVLMDIRDRRDDIMTSPTPMGRFVGLRKVTGCPSEVSDLHSPYDCSKAAAMLHLVQEALRNDQKVVIFCWHVFTIQYLNQYLRKAGIVPALIYGEMSLEQRELNKNAFQSNPECKVIIGNFEVAGAGIELTAASLLLEYEMPWTSADEIQAQDRCHRIGTTSTLSCVRLIAKNTVDERVMELVDTKEELSASVEGKKKLEVIINQVFDTFV